MFPYAPDQFGRDPGVKSAVRALQDIKVIHKMATKRFIFYYSKKTRILTNNEAKLPGLAKKMVMPYNNQVLSYR